MPENRLPPSPATDFSERLARFREEFGFANGTIWAIAGISRVEALERHCDLLQAEHAAAVKKQTEQLAELNAIVAAQERQLRAVQLAMATLN